LVDPPRTVRCAKCAHDWLAAPVADDPIIEEAEPALEEVAAAPVAPPVAPAPVALEPAAKPVAAKPPPQPEIIDDTPLSAIERLAVAGDLSPRVRRRDRVLTAAWAASFAALAAMGVAGYTERDRLMQEWPASKRVYVTLGLIPLDMKADDSKAAAGARTP
jgi:hypothetical protein